MLLCVPLFTCLHVPRSGVALLYPVVYGLWSISTLRMPDLLAADLSHFWTTLAASANTGTHTHTYAHIMGVIN